MLRYLTLSILLVVVGAVLNGTKSAKPYYDLADAEKLFADFIDTYDKHYETPEEYNQRFQIFKKKLAMINNWNKNHEASFSVNQFADKAPSENMTGFVPSRLRNKKRKLFLRKNLRQNVPDRLDYREFGYVTEVKDQGNCDSCYVFGAVGIIEGQYAKLTGELISLSEQMVMDCLQLKCANYGHDILIIRRLSKLPGLVSDEYYPYEDKVNDGCFVEEQDVKVKVTSGSYIYTPDEETLKAALVEHGPLSIAIYMSESLRQYNDSKVFKPFDCDDHEINHFVLLVGYSTDDNGTPYWIIKNSYGTGWGHNGYLYLEMGKGHCSILTEGAVTVNVTRP